MNDETNQMMDSGAGELPDNLFDDEVETAVETETAEVETESDSKVEQTDETDGNGVDQTEDGGKSTEASIRVKFNGEEKDISLSEARTLAQKGMNYDHIVEERDRNKNAFDFLMEQAKSKGMTVEDYIAGERANAENQRIVEKMRVLRERDDDASDETLRTLAKLELAEEEAKKKREEAEASEIEKNNEIEGWNKLFKAHPELIEKDGQTKITDEVVKLVRERHSPTEAYYRTRIKELEEKSKIAESAEKAKAKSIGSLRGDQTTEEDSFLEGFNSL